MRVSKGMGEWTKDEPADSNPASSSTIVPFLPTVRNNQSDAVNIELPFHHNNSSSNTLPQSDSTSSCIVVESSFNRLESFEDIDNEESSQLLPKFMDSQSSIIKSTPLVVTNAYQSNSLLKSNINKGVVSEYGAITCGD